MLLLYAVQLPLTYITANRIITPGPVLRFPCVWSPNVHVWLIVCVMDRKKVAPFLMSCHGLVHAFAALQLFFCQLETAICVRMNCVDCASSAVLSAFPLAPSSKEQCWMTRKKRLVLASQKWAGDSLHYCDAAHFRYLFKCPSLPRQQLLILKMHQGLGPGPGLVQVRLPFLLWESLKKELKWGAVFRTAGIRNKTAFKCR